MEWYKNSSRGTFQSQKKAGQLVSFEGMQYTGHHGIKNVSPTDIDGYIQLDEGSIFIFFELKYSGEPPDGQKHAYEELVDGLRKSGKNSVLFVARHNTSCVNDLIIAKDAIVVSTYWNGKWYGAQESRTLGQMINSYIQYVVDQARKKVVQDA